MKRLLGIFICIIITTGAGYKGTLPDIEAEFAYRRTAPVKAAPPFTPQENQQMQDLKPIPRENKSYLEIILKKDKSSDYVNCTNDIITILEKLKKCIESKQDIQKFNAIVSNLIDNIEFLRIQYQGKPEENFISYKNLQTLSTQARSVAVLRTESQIYTKYLPFGSSGSIYKSNNIQKQIDDLAISVDQSLFILKNTD